MILCVFRPEELDCYDFLMPLYFPTDENCEVGGPGQVEPSWIPVVYPPKEAEKEGDKEAEVRAEADAEVKVEVRAEAEAEVEVEAKKEKDESC